MKIEKIENLVQTERDERSMELYNKKESELSIGEKLTLEKYIADYYKPHIWRGIAPSYEVSNFGEIRNSLTLQPLKPQLTEFGYLRVCIRFMGHQYTVKVHRLVATAFIPNPGNKREVNHISCVKTCNWVGNLEWSTSAENKKHAREHGLYHDVCGQDKYNVRYTDEQIHEVCRLLQEGYGPAYIAKKMDIPVSCPVSIKYNGRWKHIASQYKIPKIGVKKPSRNKGGSKYTDDQIRQVCELLSKGMNCVEIEKVTGVKASASGRIYRRDAWTGISKDYVFPDTLVYISEVTKKKDDIIKLFESGESDYGVILSKMGLPDTRPNRKAVAGIKLRMKK